MSSGSRAVVALTLVVALWSCAPATAADPGATLLLSRPSGLGPLPAVGDNEAFSGKESISGNGRLVVFVDRADDLGVRDTTFHVWVRDTAFDVTTLVDRAPGGAPSDAGADRPSISSDGSTACFISSATNLVPGVTGVHVYVVTLSSGATVVADRADTAVGAVGNDAPQSCVLDAAGGHVAFDSGASNLVAGDTNGLDDVFVRDLAASTTERVSVTSTGAEAANGGREPSITANGMQIAFTAFDSLIGATDSNQTSDIYVRNTQADTTQRVSVATGSVQANGPSFSPSISDDGGTVAFASGANNLAGGPDTNDKHDVFVRLSGADTTFAASRASGSGGDLGDGDSERPAISGDGLGVAFVSEATNLGAGAPPAPFREWAYLRRIGGAQPTLLLSRASGPSGAPADGSSFEVSLPTQPNQATFDSGGGNLDPAASGEFNQVFKRDLTGGEPVTLVSRPSGDGPRSSLVNSTSVSGQRAVSADGRRILMASLSDSLEPAGAGRSAHLYVRDSLTDTTTLVDRGPGADGAVANGSTSQGSISADGRRVAFVTDGTNLLPGVNGPAVFVRDLDTNERFLASRKDGPGGDPVDAANFGGTAPAIDADGSRVAFVSSAPALPEDTNSEFDVYVRDLATGTTTLASAGPNGVGNGRSLGPAIDADGTDVAFQSTSTNLLGDLVSPGHVYVRDLAAGTIVLADRRSGDGAPGTSQDPFPQISGDGSRVVFATNQALTPDPLPAGDSGIYVRDLAAQTTTLASRADGPSGPAANGARVGALSLDGEHVAFSAFGPGLPGSPPAGQSQAYVRDLAAQTTTLVSAVDGTPLTIANGGTGASALSEDGGCVAFTSSADNLTNPGYPTRDFAQAYLRVVSGECPKVAAGPPGPGPGPGPTPDLDPPHFIGGLVLAHRTFRAAARGASVAARRRSPTGTRVTFRLDEAAAVLFRVERALPGRRVGRRCVKPTRKNRKRRKCTRFVPQRGSFRVAGRAGTTRFRFTGRLRNRKLKPGRYRLVAVATDAAGNKSAPKRARFKIVRLSRSP